MNILSKFKKIKPEVRCIIDKLKTGELEIRDVPAEFSLDPNVIQAERALGIRKSRLRGFDVITQSFLWRKCGFIKIYWVIFVKRCIRRLLIHLPNIISS